MKDSWYLNAHFTVSCHFLQRVKIYIVDETYKDIRIVFIQSINVGYSL